MVWLLLLIVSLRPGAAHYKDTKTHELHGSARDDKAIVPPPPASNQAPSSTSNCPAPPQQSAEDASHWWNTPEWWTFGVTVCYTLVSGCALVVIWRQNRSIQNTERAVLIPQWDNFVHLTPEGMGRKQTLLVNFTNSGKTPAFVRGHQCNIVLVDSITALPTRPRYKSEVVYQGDPVIPAACTDRAFYALLEDVRDFDEIEDDYRTNGRVLYGFGFVRYEDIYGSTHITRYGIRYDARPSFSSQYDRWVIDGPESYNGYS